MRLKMFVCFMLVSTLTLLSPLTFAQNASLNLDDLLPVDPRISKGVLPNGLTYYVRANSTPENRADLYLVVNAGSMEEDDDQQGMAHFLEHMAFNGTRNFPGNEVVKYLESLGMRFGPDVNASTSFNETIYTIKVPLDENEYLEKGLQMLYDWAHQITLDDAEIEKERGVVYEEWRSGQNAANRMRQQWLPVALQGSRYAQRLPIGKTDIINNGSPEAIRRYFRDWYRPDLQAVIAVGDFDQNEVVRLITEKFSDIPAAVNPRAKEDYSVPGHDETLVAIVTDKEQPLPIAQIYHKHPLKQSQTLRDYRENIKATLYNAMLGQRLGELARSENPPFIQGQAGYQGFIGTTAAFGLVAVCHNDRITDGIRAVLLESEKVKRHGFTQTEFDRIRKALITSIEMAYNERDKQQSQSYAEEYMRNFTLTREAIPGIENERTYFNVFLNDITLEEINALSAQWITPDNRVLILTAPEKEDVRIPSESEVLAVLGEVEKSGIEAYEDEVIDRPLIDGELKSGVVVKEKPIKHVDATEWTLSNGATVIYKTTDFKDNEILFTAYSPGGNSLYGQEYDVSSDFVAPIMSMSGVADFDLTTLQKMLSDKAIAISLSLSDYTENFSGSATPQDLETMLQMLHLYFTAPRVEEKAYSSYMQRLRSTLANRDASPETAFSDMLTITSTNGHPRKRPMTLELLGEADLAAIDRIARERFHNASDFKFFFVGNIDSETFRPLVERYIGSIPSEKKTEKWNNLHVNPPRGVVTRTVNRGVEPRSTSYIVFHGKVKYKPETVAAVNMFSSILNTRLLDLIREDKGNVYSISVSPSFGRIPEEKYSITITYGCAPEKVEELRDTVFAEIRKLGAEGPTADELKTAREKLLRDRETAVRLNNFWTSFLSNGYLVEKGKFEEMGKYQSRVNGVTLTQMKKAVTLFDFNNYFSVSLKPENFQ